MGSNDHYGTNIVDSNSYTYAYHTTKKLTCSYFYLCSSSLQVIIIKIFEFSVISNFYLESKILSPPPSFLIKCAESSTRYVPHWSSNNAHVSNSTPVARRRRSRASPLELFRHNKSLLSEHPSYTFHIFSRHFSPVPSSLGRR